LVPVYALPLTNEMSDSLFRWPLPGRSPSLSDDALLHSMLRFEVALARTQASLGLIPSPAAAAIARYAPSFRIDSNALARSAAHAGSLAIPFVAALRGHLHQHDREAADHLHFGTTSQDLLDTALVLCLKPALAELQSALLRCRDAAVALARTHRATPVLARTLLQPAGITTIGFKAAQWAGSLSTASVHIEKSATDALVVSLGGTIGNLGAYGDKGAQLRAALAQLLELGDPGRSWHTQRERLVALAADIGISGGTMAKIARDLSLMMQFEVGEASEPSSTGRGGSTAMPHKRNPVLTMRVLATLQPLPGWIANLLSAMVQEHERGLGNWQAEIDQYRMLVDNALAGALALAELLEGVRFDVTRCRANIDALYGTIFSEALTTLLAPALGKANTQECVAALCSEAVETKRPLRDLALGMRDADPALSGIAREDIAAVFEVQRAARASERETEAMLRTIEMTDL